ncbi:MAG TPA: hypothetical protein DC013_09010 [Ruminococcaceae bacterium]|jgi:polyhydroxyalkanoate synthesis regulator phasin|nr:hypothetical protein [Oscillospiraceae bacterium]
MTDLFEKSINLGLGLFLYSREKVEEIVEGLVSKGEVSQKDARRVAAELIQKGREQREEMEKLVRDELTKALDRGDVARKVDLVTKDEIREIVREEIRQALREKEGGKPEDAE